jgi:hypothetical protein
MVVVLPDNDLLARQGDDENPGRFVKDEVTDAKNQDEVQPGHSVIVVVFAHR